MDSNYTVNAVYKSGAYSYSCKIEKTENYVCITPTSTNAKGMSIKCNGKKVEFSYQGLKKSFDIANVDKTNPAVILYGVLFDCKEEGTTTVGKYSVKSEKGKPIQISIPNADILVMIK